MTGYEITPVDVWVGEVEDRPGGLSSKLARLMMCAGANLEMIIARPAPERPGCGVIYLAPLRTSEQMAAAREVGLHKSENMHCLRLVGPDRAGLAAGIAGTLADAEINIKGLSATGSGGRAVVYLRFDSQEDAVAARAVLARALSTRS